MSASLSKSRKIIFIFIFIFCLYQALQQVSHATVFAMVNFLQFFQVRAAAHDNATIESWNHSFKVEVVHGERFLTRAETKSHVVEYIEV